ncbi:hypothetical protein B7Y94_02830 [Candidatus Saccharibacteria bacterium 32-49-12]|nr:MAG: hypothetical protein B7Y94_02830 [Candidatus Saccharibacteria bacterium 32-49-12]
MINTLLSIIAPHYCYSCGEPGSILCSRCKNDITEEPFSHCLICLKPSHHDNICQHHSLPYSHLWCVDWRSGEIEMAIDALKFKRAKSAASDLADLLDFRLPDFSDPPLVVPIPTTSRNIRIRGYDHMKLIAKSLAKKRGWRTEPLIARQNNTTQHFARSASERRKQAVTFFRLRTGVKINSSAHYLIVDDIFTTGSTVAAAANCLKRAGAAKISVAVLARQRPKGSSIDDDTVIRG